MGTIHDELIDTEILDEALGFADVTEGIQMGASVVAQAANALDPVNDIDGRVRQSVETGEVSTDLVTQVLPQIQISIVGGPSETFVLTPEDVEGFDEVIDLIDHLNARIAGSSLNGQIRAETHEGRLVLVSTGIGSNVVVNVTAGTRTLETATTTFSNDNPVQVVLNDVTVPGALGFTTETVAGTDRSYLVRSLTFEGTSPTTFDAPGPEVPGDLRPVLFDDPGDIAEGVNFGSLPELIVNGGFETGDFSGWTVVTTGGPELTPWTVGGSGGGSFGNTSPRSGQFDAFNGFDGGAGLEYELFQDVTLPADVVTAMLVTNHRIQFDSLGIPSTLARELDVTIRDTSGTLLETLYEEDALLDGLPQTDRGWNTQRFDLSAFAGQSIRVHMRMFIPEEFTGPGNIEFDDISLLVNDGTLTGAADSAAAAPAGPDGSLGIDELDDDGDIEDV